jgi:RHS repeat-associated protein
VKSKFPRVWRWLRLDRFLYSVVAWGDERARKLGRKLRAVRAKVARAVHQLPKKVPRCLPRKKPHLGLEQLEPRVCMSVVSFSSSTYSVNENAGTKTFTVQLDAPAPGSISVDYATVAGGTATAGRDFTSTSGTLNFAIGDQTKTFNVTINNDGVTDADESVNLQLSNAVGATLGSPSSTTLTITDTNFFVPTASSSPQSVTAGPDGIVWFVENAAAKLAKVTPSGSFTEYTIGGVGSTPVSVVAGPDGKMWVADSGGKQIVAVTTSGSTTSYSTNLNTPIAITSDGSNLWYDSTGSFALVELDTTGTLVGQWTGLGSTGPLVYGPDGDLWIAAGTAIKRFDPGSGTVVATYLPSGAANALCVGPDNNIWFTESGTNKIGQLTLGGVLTEFSLSTPGTNPSGVCAGPDGALYFTEANLSQLARITTSGTITEYSGLSSHQPVDICLGGDGLVWFDEPANNKIGKFGGLVAGGIHTDDPQQTEYFTFGQSKIAPGDGSFLLAHALDLNQNTAAPIPGGAPALVYASATVAPQPIVEATLATDSLDAVPTSLQARLTWNGGSPGSWVTFSTSGHSAGDTYVMDIQVGSAVTSTGLYSWTMDVKATYPNSYVVTRSVSGSTPVVVIGTATPFGQGWGLAGLDRLIPVSGGVLWVYGASGTARFFSTLNGAGGITYFLSPPNDFGSLQQNADLSYTYNARDLSQVDFNSSGYLTKYVDPHGLPRTFLYDAGNKVTGIQDIDGSVATLAYDGNNHLSTIDAPGSRRVTVTITAGGSLTGIVNPDGGLRTLAYDGSGRLQNDKFGPLNGTYAYDSGNGTLATILLDSVTTESIKAQSTQGLATSPAISQPSSVGVLTDALNKAYKFYQDYYGRSATITAPDGTVQAMIRDNAGQVVRSLDADHVMVTNLYNYGSTYKGDLQSLILPGGFAIKQVDDATVHEPSITTDQNNHTTGHTYNSYGDVLTTTDALNNTTTNTWSNGLLQTTQDPNGELTTLLYDAARRVTGTLDPTGALTQNLYDAAGNATVAIDALGNRTTSAFDGMRRVTSVIQPNGQQTTMLYNAIGLVTSTTDPLGRHTNYGYDQIGRRNAVTQAAGTAVAQTTTTLFDVASNATGVIDANNNLTKYLFDAQNRNTVTVDPLGNRTTTLLDAAGNTTGTIDPRGNLTQYLLDNNERSTVTIDALGNRTTQLLDPVGNLTGQLDARGNLTQYLVDADNRTSVTIDALGNRVTTLFDSTGNATGTLDARANLTQRLYDNNDRLTVTIDALNNRATTLYDANGNVTGQLDARGSLTQYLLDASARQTVTVDALNNRVTSLYDQFGNVTGTQDALGHLSQQQFDALNRLTVTIDAVGNRTTTLYDLVGNVTGRLDPLGHLNQYLVDADNRTSVTIDPLGNRTTSLFDAAGNVTGVKDPLGNLVQHLFDADNRETVTIDGAGNRTTALFDPAGNVTGVLDPRNNLTQHLFDADNRETVTIDALSNRATTLFDPAGNVTGTQDQLGNLTQHVFDADNRASVIIDALSNRTTTLFDPASNVTGVKDARGNLTQHLFDADNRETVTIDALANRTTTLFDAASNVTGMQDPRGNLTQHLFDADNRETVTIDALSNRTTTLLDAAGNVTGMLDPRNNLTQHLFDADNRQTVTIDALSNRTTSLLDATGNLTGTQDPRGNLTQYLFDADNRASVTIDALSNRTTTLFDPASNVTGVKDALGNLTQHLFDADNRETVSVDALSNRTTSLLDAAGNLTGTQDPRGNLTQFLFDADNRQAVSVDALSNRTTTLLDAVGNVTGRKDPLGNLTQFLFDADNRQSVTIDALNNRATVLFDAASNVTGVQDARGSLTQHLFDADNRETVTVDALSNRTTSLLDPAGNVTGVKDPLNNLTQYLFDADNRKSVTVDALSNRVTTLFDATSNVTGVQDPRGNLTQFLFDADNRKSVTVDALLGRATTLFDPAGNVTGQQDQLGNLTQHLFDADNRETVTVDALTNRTTTLLDAAGNATGVKDALGNLTQFLFDADNRQTVSVDALGNRTTTLLDAAGNVSGQLDAKNHLTQYLFDANNRKTVTIDALNYRTTTLLDAVGNMTMLKDASSNSTSFLYDADNRLTSQTDPLGHTGTIAYDADSHQTSVTDRDGRIRNYFYDAIGRVTGQTWYTTGGTSVTANITMMYDATSNVTVAAANYGAYTMMYDALNRVTVAQEPFNQTLTMGFDAASNRTTVQDKFGTETSIYDADNRLQTREYAGISTTKVREDLTYQANDVLGTAKRYSDLTASTQVGASTLLYDAANRVTGINDFNGSGGGLVSQTYLMDAVGNITHEVDNGSRTLDYTYDSDNQLTADSLNTFTYDGTGNRNNTGWSTPAGNENELQSDAIAGGTWAYAYDPEGNVIKKSLGISADTWIYEYDDANHMTVAQEYTKDPGSGGVIIQEWDSEYDAFGNRIDYFEHVGGSTEQRYSLDGWDPPTQGATGNARWEVYADLDGTSSLTTRYLRGDEVDQVFARIASDGTAAWLLTDHLGSVVGVTDNSGVLKDSILYDAWGNITSESTPSQGGRYKWTGREQDAGTGLQANRGRVYDASTSTWMSQDPLGFSAGDSNLYRYVFNRDSFGEDPSGLQGGVPKPPPTPSPYYGSNAYTAGYSNGYDPLTGQLLTGAAVPNINPSVPEGTAKAAPTASAGSSRGYYDFSYLPPYGPTASYQGGNVDPLTGMPPPVGTAKLPFIPGTTKPAAFARTDYPNAAPYGVNAYAAGYANGGIDPLTGRVATAGQAKRGPGPGIVKKESPWASQSQPAQPRPRPILETPEQAVWLIFDTKAKLPAPLNVTVGHPALLIGSDEEGWRYYSFHAGNPLTTADNMPELRPFKTLKGAQENPEIAQYDGWILLTTKQREVAKARAIAEQWKHGGLWGNDQPYSYNLLWQSCAHFASDVGKVVKGFPQFHFKILPGPKSEQFGAALGIATAMGVLPPVMPYRGSFLMLAALAHQYTPNEWWKQEVVPWAIKERLTMMIK